MSLLKVEIHKIKKIKHGFFEFPLDNNLYAIVGGNGTGKSTLMLCISQLIGKHNLSILRHEDYFHESCIKFEYNDQCATWFYDQNSHKDHWKAKEFPNNFTLNGTYEGSLFYGNRFRNSRIVDGLLERGKINNNDIIDSDTYIQEKLGDILHNDPGYYKGLKRIKNKEIAVNLGLKNTPYFMSVGENFISQYRMSSGECLLISLLHFIYNSLIRKSLPRDKPILMLIDEIELALHPVAVSNFISYIRELLKEYKNLTILVTSHAPEVIRLVNPNNMYKIRYIADAKNELEITNPCYPSYAIRDIYQHVGFDLLILVEDKLAKMLIDYIIKEKELKTSRLIHVIPVGGYDNVLQLHSELLINNTLGVGTKIVSILDGDVENKVNAKQEYERLKKIFLPIESIEKYLHKNLISNPNRSIIKEIQDSLFNIESIDDFINNYKKDIRKELESRSERQNEAEVIKLNEISIEEQIKDVFKDGKRLYKSMIQKLSLYRISEEELLEVVFKLV